MNKKEIFLSTLLLLILLTIVFFSLKKQQSNQTYQSPVVEEKVTTALFPDPKPIEKPDQIKNVEKIIHIRREIVQEQNITKISAFIENINLLEKDIVLEDLSETIKVEKKSKLSGISINIPQGKLFPQAKFPQIATYGHGDPAERKSKITITILDINLGKNSKETKLYDIEYKTAHNSPPFHIDPMEIRSNKYILELNGNTKFSKNL